MAAKKEQINETKNDLKLEILGIFLIALSVFITAGLFVNIGIIGGLLVKFLKFSLGSSGMFVVPFVLLLLGVNLCFLRKPIVPGVLLLSSIFLTALHLSTGQAEPTTSLLWEKGIQGEGAGLIGAIFSIITVMLLGKTGSRILLVTLACLGLVLLTGIPLSQLLKGLAAWFLKYLVLLKEKLTDFLFVEEEFEPEYSVKNRKKKSEVYPVPIIIDHNSGRDSLAEQENTEDQSREYEKPLENQEKSRNQEKLRRQEKGSYVLPSLDLLSSPLKVKSNRINKEILENVKILEETLENFGVKICVSQVNRGPAITRYEIQPSPGVKVSKIVHLADDIALSLAAADVRIEAPIPGKAALGIEVPNKEVTPVYLREILETSEFQNAESKLTIALGKDIAGNPIIADLMKMPHLLIAGATGSGKSVCLNAIICSILYKARPDEVKFLLIDPKMVELTTYNDAPHLVSPVVIDPKKSASALKWVVSEMENRYELFASLSVRDIVRYNQLAEEEKQKQVQPLPYIIVVIDELADLMMIAPVDVEDAICRLAQMARAAGIHLVVATQRPSVDVITGIIKANIPSRIAFAVSSQVDSRTILDLNGAEKLLGRGDMLFLPTGVIKPVRVQGAFVAEEEVEKVIGFIKEQGDPLYVSEFPELETVSETKIKDASDPLFNDAGRVVIEAGHASVSLLQRRLRVGYARAARIMDNLEEKGIVGPYEGAKPRKVLMTAEQFYRSYGA